MVATINGTPIRVKDIGRAEDGTKEPRTLARLNGVPSVTLDLRRQSGANTVAVIEGVKARLAAIQAELPPDVKLEVIRDQSNTFTKPCTKFSFTWCWAASWPAWWCCFS